MEEKNQWINKSEKPILKKFEELCKGKNWVEYWKEVSGINKIIINTINYYYYYDNNKYKNSNSVCRCAAEIMMKNMKLMMIYI